MFTPLRTRCSRMMLRQMQPSTTANPFGGILLLAWLVLLVIAAVRSPAGKVLHTILYVLAFTVGLGLVSGVLGWILVRTPEFAGLCSSTMGFLAGIVTSIERIRLYRPKH